MALPQPQPDREGRLVEANLRLRQEMETLRAQDAAERDQLTRRLRNAEAHRDRAHAALEQKAELLAHMSHELRAPMNGILGMTQLALQTELSEKQRGYLDVVRSSAHMLLTLINDILDLSKLDAGRLALDHVPFGLEDSLQNTVKSLQALADEKALTMTVAIDDGVPENVVGDPGRLRQVLLNLVGNAIKFTDHGGVTVQVSRQASARGNLQLQFSVRDTGIGIPADRLSAVFQPYEQASRATSRQYGGTGLGLAICRELVDLMGGDITVESTEGAGSTFRFTAEFGVAVQRAGEFASSEDLAALTVFVLAGENAGPALAHQLPHTASRPSLFEDIERAANAAATSLPDLIVFDLDRYDLEDVKHFGPDVTTIVVTSSGQRGDAARCRELGVAAYLTRPMGPLDLRDAVRASLGRTDDTLITRHWLREHRPRLRVLVADDSTSNRAVITQMLEMQDHEVTAVADGRQAVEAFASDAPDLVFLDMEMPVMSGIEATQALREAGAEVPIIALTGHSSRDQIERCLAAGMDGHMGKPFEFDDLVAIIEAHNIGDSVRTP